MSGLEEFRAQLDDLDETIARAIARRFEVCRQVALYKREQGIAMMQPDRVSIVRERYRRLGEEAEVPAGFTDAFFDLLIGATCEMEDEIIEGRSNGRIA